MIKLGDAMSRFETHRQAAGSVGALAAFSEPVNRGDEIACAFLKEWASMGNGDSATVSDKMNIDDADFQARLDALLVQKLEGASGRVKETAASSSGGGANKSREGYKGAHKKDQDAGGNMEQNTVANLTCRVIGVSACFVRVV